MTQPTLGDRVHYVAFGTPGGEYHQTCRAAIITEVGQWVTIAAEDSASIDPNYRVRYLTQRFHDDAVALFVMNPTGVFFNGAGPVACRHAAPNVGHIVDGGTWHRVEECER